MTTLCWVVLSQVALMLVANLCLKTPSVPLAFVSLFLSSDKEGSETLGLIMTSAPSSHSYLCSSMFLDIAMGFQKD